MLRLRCTLLLLPLLAAVTVACGGPTAAAATAPCVTGAAAGTCTAWAARVDHVSDGDTLQVDVAGDGTHRLRAVRITGINATELRRYSLAHRSGQCHAVAATLRLEQLVRAGRGIVRLTARHAASRSGKRLRRSVAVQIGGQWVDTGSVLVREGHALWLPNRRESAPNAAYSALAEQAAAERLNMWNPTACGAGPSQTAGGLALWVNANANGVDARHLNGEWIKIRNLDAAAAVPLGGWWVRDSFSKRYVFPPWAVIPPGGTVTVHVGRGRSHGRTFYWGSRSAVFENPVLGRRTMGDGGYLFDPQGDLRAWMQYPCRSGCTDAAQGLLVLRARARGRESVTLRNVGAIPVPLEGYRLESPPYVRFFRPGTILPPGAVLRVAIGRRHG